jgi:hypothetical protein
MIKESFIRMKEQITEEEKLHLLEVIWIVRSESRQKEECVGGEQI